MKFLNVLQGFRLNLADGIREFEAGLQEVEDDIADHWYVKANTETVTARQARAIQAASGAQASDAPADTSAQTDATPPANTETVMDAAGV